MDHGGKLSVFKSDEDGKVYLRIVGANGEKLATSEGHENAGDVDEVIERYFDGWPVIRHPVT